MSETAVAVDVDVRRQEIQKDFIFPTGRAWAHELGYPEPAGDR